MKAITIHQPWASLIAVGAKQFETRSWPTKYRGRIAIHAGLKTYDLGDIDFGLVRGFMSATENALGIYEANNAPLGSIVATADLVECWRIVYHPGTDVDSAKHITIGAELDVPKHHPRFADFIVPSEQELLFGNWTPGRYAWELANVQMFPEPIPAKGRQGLWNWEGAV